MRILLYSSPTYSDDNAVGAWLQSIATLAAGEVTTIALHGGASGTARRLIEASDAGLEWAWWGAEITSLGGGVLHWYPDDLLQFDEIVHLWQHPDYDERLSTVARNLGIPLLEMGDQMLAERL